MDEIAHESGIDPVEFRLRNYADQDEHQNKPWSMKNLRECYERGAKKFGWSKRNPKPGSMRGPDGRKSASGWRQQFIRPVSKRPVRPRASTMMALWLGAAERTSA